MLKSEAAAYLAGVTQTEGAEASAPTNLHVITGEVGESSANGKTLVKIDGLMFSESDDQFIEVDALGGLEEGDIATIVLTGEQGHAMTPLALGSIGSVDRITVRIAAIEADYIKVEQLDAATARIGELEADHVSVDDLNAATARIGTLETTRATITDLEAAEARIGTLESDHVSTDDLDAATARIGTLETNTADIGTIRANSAKVQNLTAAQLEADHATIGSLSTNYAHITNGVIDNAKIGYADVNNLSAHYAEIQNGKIDSALINTAAIVDEQVFTVTGNKATLAQIDASKINVLNLKAKDIEVERINGQPVTNKTLVDALSQHETDISDLDTKIDDEVEALNERIDGAIETFTGTVVPTLNNTPASQWNTVALKDQHVGDVYYVVNSQSAQNGYCYRFTKSGSTYSWQLIKDSDVTAALSRLQTAEGKIGNIEQFDETVGSFMTDTDDELSSLKTRTTSLETSIGDKVDTSTFNTVSQKVDANEANITSMSTVLTNNGLTSSTNITNTVNTVKQTADTNKASITSLTQTVNNKADSTTVTTLTNRVSTVEQNLSGITTRVGKTESELETVSNPNLSPFFSFALDNYYNASSNPDGYWNSSKASVVTNLSDGWAHYSQNNTGSSTIWLTIYEHSAWRHAHGDLKGSTKYTVMIEFRNVTKSGNVTCIGTCTHASSWPSMFVGNSDKGNVAVADGVQYHIGTTVADPSSVTGSTCTTRTLITIPAGASIDCDMRVSLYEGEYSGPYKPYVDQTLSNRVKSAETSIEQNAEDITLRATKADVQSLGGNLLTDTDNPVLGSNIAPKYSVVSGGNGTGTIATVTDSPLPNFKKSFRITGNTSGNRDFAQSVGIVYGQKYLFTAYARGIGGNATALVRVFSGSELFTYTTVVGTDWTPIRTIVTLTGAGSAAYYFFQFGLTGAGSIEYIAPCLSGGAAANTAAELKVANDNINLKVSKNDVINQINVSTEGVKIDADKVEIDGTAVFNAAKSKLDAAYDAKGAASAVEQGLGGFDILWNRVSYDSDENAGGECYICAYDPITAIRSNANGWVMWNGAKRTIPRGGINPNNIVPYNIPVYLVCRLSSATSDTGTMYMVWYNSGWKYAVTPTPTAVGGTWTWTETTDMVIGKFVEPGSEVAFTECETYRQPLKWGSITTDTVTARSANAAAASAQSTANAAAPKANAVKRTQRIWYRTNASSAPATPGTASSNWVTKADDGNDAWTKMHIAISGTHKYIYTCEQYEMANGTVGYTSVLLDNTITVIDGGNIITGTVTANKLNAADINASKSLTVGAMTDAAASTILNSNVQIGGRNLLYDTSGWSKWAKTAKATATNDILTCTNTDTSSGFQRANGWFIPDKADVMDREIVISFDAKKTDSTALSSLVFQMFTTSAAPRSVASGNINEGTRYYINLASASSNKVTILNTSEINSATWTRVSIGFIPSQVFNTSFTEQTYLAVYVGISSTVASAQFRHIKAEYGNKATDWTPAPEDMATSSSVDQTYVQNLTPYFLTDMTKTSDEYWANLTYERFSRLGDGWAHFEYTNNGSSTVNNYIKPKVLDFLEPGGKYTLLIEFKNVSISKDGGTFYSQQGSDLQVWGDSSYCGFSIPNATIRALSGGAGTFYRTLTLLTADSKDPSGTVRGSLPKTSFMSINSQVAAGQTVSYDLRLSLYADGYTGPYKPYSGDQLYATNSALAGTNESLDGAIADIGELSDQLSGTVTEQNKTITDIQRYLNSLRKDLDAEIQSRQQWLNFNSAEGLVIGAAGSSFKTVTTNTSQQFRSGGTVLAETSGTEFVAPVMRSNQLLIGNWMWTRRDNGNLSLKWIG